MSARLSLQTSVRRPSPAASLATSPWRGEVGLEARGGKLEACLRSPKLGLRLWARAFLGALRLSSGRTGICVVAADRTNRVPRLDWCSHIRVVRMPHAAPIVFSTRLGVPHDPCGPHFSPTSWSRTPAPNRSRLCSSVVRHRRRPFLGT